MVQLVELDDALRRQVEQFRGSVVVSRGRVHRMEELAGFVALERSEMIGLVTYAMEGNECEIVSLDSRAENQGIGSRLLELVIGRATDLGCGRVWLITSNANIKAISFYQKRGFDMFAIHRDAITEARKQKPTIPMRSADGIWIRHEIELEYVIESKNKGECI